MGYLARQLPARRSASKDTRTSGDSPTLAMFSVYLSDPDVVLKGAVWEILGCFMLGNVNAAGSAILVRK